MYLLIAMVFLAVISDRCSDDDENDNNLPLPELTTTEVTLITQTTAVSGGNVISDGGFAVSSRGICWGTGNNPGISGNTTSDGAGTGTYTSNLTGLSPGTKYYVRAYATNANGTAYGASRSFTTEQGIPETVTDEDGNVYHTIVIGSQVWLRENLNVTHYRNGDPIPNITDGAQWDIAPSGAYCNYENNDANSTTYGRLYNWRAVVDSRSICPEGWHVPSDEEWSTLTTFLGGENVAGGFMKEALIAHWNPPNTQATNGSQFTALPGGYRQGPGPFQAIGYAGYWWSATEHGSGTAWFRQLSYDLAKCIRSSHYIGNGCSVRCLMD